MEPMPYYKRLLSLTMCLACFQAIGQIAMPGKLSDSASRVIHICLPSRTAIIRPTPLYIIRSHNTELKSKSPIVLNMLNPQQIKSISIFKDSVARADYGDDATEGVIIATLDDEKYPNAYKF